MERLRDPNADTGGRERTKRCGLTNFLVLAALPDHDFRCRLETLLTFMNIKNPTVITFTLASG